MIVSIIISIKAKRIIISVTNTLKYFPYFSHVYLLL